MKPCVASRLSTETLKSSRGSLTTLATLSNALAIVLLICAERRNGRYPKNCATTNLSILADTLQRMPCVACVKQRSQKQTADIAGNCQIMHAWNASTVVTKCYAREIFTASLTATRSIVLFVITLMWIRGAKLRRNGGPVQSRSITF